jgi:hypothetical protein
MYSKSIFQKLQLLNSFDIFTADDENGLPVGALFLTFCCCCIDLIQMQKYGSSRPLCVALQCEGVPWTEDFYLARPLVFPNRLYG